MYIYIYIHMYIHICTYNLYWFYRYKYLCMFVYIYYASYIARTQWAPWICIYIYIWYVNIYIYTYNTGLYTYILYMYLHSFGQLWHPILVVSSFNHRSWVKYDNMEVSWNRGSPKHHPLYPFIDGPMEIKHPVIIRGSPNLGNLQ